MSKGYKYEFDREQCWYKSQCSLYRTSECNDSCIRYLEMHYLMENSGVPKKKQYPDKLTPAKTDVDSFLYLNEIKEDIEEFVKNGENLYIFSDGFGNGKTSWAIKILLRYFDKVWAGNGFRKRGIFIHVPTLLTKIKEGFTHKDPEFEALRHSLIDVDLVIWDDIAATNISNYDHTLLMTYIDQRLLNEKSNVFTGNLCGDALYDAIGNRLGSRVWESSIQIEIKDMKDHRGARYK